MRRWVAEDHLARFVVSLVRDELDLSAIYASYAGEKGQPPYHPAMMTALLLYGCAVGLTNSQSDQQQLAPLLDGIAAHLGHQPKEVSADFGYCSEANLARLDRRGIAGYVAVARAKHPAAAKRQRAGPLTRAMQRKLRRAGRRSRYRLRKQTVEPVFGQIKAARGFRQFLLRGIDKVKAEWAMLCTARNLLKLKARAA